MHGKVLFLTLKTFSFTGGIEKVCRSISKVIYDLEQKDLLTGKVYSMYDADQDADARYISKQNFKGFGGNKIRFITAAVQTGIKSDTVILSHVNLLLAACLIKFLSPKTRIVLIAHGIEMWRPLKSWKVNFIKKQAKIWAVSSFTAQKVKDIHHISNKIDVLNNCLDPFFKIPTHFEKPTNLLKRYQLMPDQPVLFTLCRLSFDEKYKGYDQVIEALPDLLKLYPNLRYFIAGKADEAEKQRLTDLIGQYNLQKHIQLLGFIADEELVGHFLLTDVFIMPSRMEGFGIVFTEAAACGCKLIGGNHDGTKDALLDGQLGTLVDPVNTAEIRNAISENLGKPRSERSSQEIQSLCLSNFHYNHYVRQVQKLMDYA